jgi:hypothetical protein
LITNERQNLLAGMAVNVALGCYSAERYALRWNVLPAEFAELVAHGGKDTDAVCNDGVRAFVKSVCVSAFGSPSLLVAKYLLPHFPPPVFRIVCD